jgi:predicted alpha/beta superfamily hydrolase
MKRAFVTIFCCILLQIVQGQGVPSTRKEPFVLGTIHQIQSKVLSEERRLNIYLPEGYSPSDTVRYPVIYLLDGSADEDFIHVVGLAQFLSFSWVDILPKSIVVGIANVDRRRDFTFPTTIAKDKKDFPTTGASEKFIAFMEKELQPYVQKHFKTTAAKTIIGQSLGGLLATEILFTKPHLFTNYIIVSPSLWWDNESLLNKSPAVLQPNYTTPTSIYIAAGNEGKIMEDDTKRLVAILNSTHKNNLQVSFRHFPEENHGTILHLALYRAFQTFQQKK